MTTDDFDMFWRTHLMTSSHGYQIPETTILYWNATKSEQSNYPWIRREGTPRSHAAAAVARDLMTQVRVANKRTIISVTIVQNYSPCLDCADELLKTIQLANEKQIRLDMSISFVALKNIRRPSWLWRGLREATTDIPVNESNDNAFALLQLNSAGVRLTTFTPDTWKFLYTFLGNGFPSNSPGKFLDGKFSSTDSRFEEDRLMQLDLEQIFKGVLFSPECQSADNCVLLLEWNHPVVSLERIQDYRITCKKVTVKNKEAEDRFWRIGQVLDKEGIKVTVPGEMTWWKVMGLDADAFYDVTVEATIKGMVVSSARKIFKTTNKVPIPALQTPVMVRKSNVTSRPKSGSVTSPTVRSPQCPTPTPLRRSNSIRDSTPSSSRSSITSDLGIRLGNGHLAESSLQRSSSLRVASSRNSIAGSVPESRAADRGGSTSNHTISNPFTSLRRKFRAASVSNQTSTESKF
ncbi:uncharacterized protein LOC106054687 [Biomphalaria glabrata]|uniref:Uncharacterized protein LOC106054687 n=1 Tax=Biomphalaria glabrata TaxID=6526 RepID=A0A9W2YSR3_BIOGL|nr:uncharacterized protein LOC106054687 [Biomphalaria glabrata]